MCSTELSNDEMATERLTSLCLRSDFNPDPMDVEACALNGADVVFTPQCSFYPILHRLLTDSTVEVVRACLKTTRKIDFSIVGHCGRNVLQLASEERLSDKDAEAFVKAIVYRIETHPLDTVCWEQKDVYGRDFIALAAENQKLSVLWPIVKHMPAFADRCIPISLPVVWKWDFSRLDTEDQHEQFSLLESEAIIDIDYPTAKLCKLSWESNPDAGDILLHVLNGGNIMFLDPQNVQSVFHNFIEKGNAHYVYACLRTKRSIDFSHRNYSGCSVLDALFWEFRNNGLPDLLDAVIDHVEAQEEEEDCSSHDCINWEDEDEDGYSFLTHVAEEGILSEVWRTLKRRGVPALMREGRAPIPIRCGVDEVDWLELDEEDRRCFSRCVA